MKLAAAVLGAVFMSANAADQWVVSAPIQGADKAPTFIVTGADPSAWPLDYPLVKGWDSLWRGGRAGSSRVAGLSSAVRVWLCAARCGK